MTKTLFRMRSMDKLIGKEFKELHSRTIYFAKPDELNDPLDGSRSYFWDGDEIVWGICSEIICFVCIEQFVWLNLLEIIQP